MTNFIKEQANKIAKINAQIKYLEELFEGGLDCDAEEYVGEYMDILAESIEKIESNYFNMGVEDKEVRQIFAMADSMNLKVDDEFVQHVARYI